MMHGLSILHGTYNTLITILTNTCRAHSSDLVAVLSQKGMHTPLTRKLCGICSMLQSSQTHGTGMHGGSCHLCQRGRSSQQSRVTTPCRGPSLCPRGERAHSRTCGREMPSSRTQSGLPHLMARQRRQQHHQRWDIAHSSAGSAFDSQETALACKTLYGPP